MLQTRQSTEIAESESALESASFSFEPKQYGIDKKVIPLALCLDFEDFKRYLIVPYSSGTQAIFNLHQFLCPLHSFVVILKGWDRKSVV